MIRDVAKRLLSSARWAEDSVVPDFCNRSVYGAGSLQQLAKEGLPLPGKEDSRRPSTFSTRLSARLPRLLLISLGLVAGLCGGVAASDQYSVISAIVHFDFGDTPRDFWESLQALTGETEEEGEEEKAECEDNDQPTAGGEPLPGWLKALRHFFKDGTTMEGQDTNRHNGGHYGFLSQWQENSYYLGIAAMLPCPSPAPDKNDLEQAKQYLATEVNHHYITWLCPPQRAELTKKLAEYEFVFTDNTLDISEKNMPRLAPEFPVLLTERHAASCIDCSKQDDGQRVALSGAFRKQQKKVDTDLERSPESSGARLEPGYALLLVLLGYICYVIDQVRKRSRRKKSSSSKPKRGKATHKKGTQGKKRRPRQQ